MYEDSHLEADYEDRVSGSIESWERHGVVGDLYPELDRYDDDDFDMFDDDDDASVPFCQLHSAEHEAGGFLCSLVSEEAFAGTE
jgi:hypothetical protein